VPKLGRSLDPGEWTVIKINLSHGWAALVENAVLRGPAHQHRKCWCFLLCGSFQNPLETDFGVLNLFWRGIFPETGLLLLAQLPAVVSG